MSFTRRILEGARSGLNSIVEKVAADDTPLSHVREEELRVELEARQAAQAKAPAPEQNPRARYADSSEGSRAQRARLAKDREGRIHAERDRRERTEREARERAWQRMKEEAARQAASGGASSSRTSSGGAGSQQRRTGAGAGARFGFGRQDPKIAEHYKTLNLPYGADFAEVKSAYRKLIRRYHPDLQQDEKKQKAATELTMRITAAYNELEIHLTGGPNKSN